jgi:hypothetical protein
MHALEKAPGGGLGMEDQLGKGNIVGDSLEQFLRGVLVAQVLVLYDLYLVLVHVDLLFFERHRFHSGALA